jgi:hypothetical protein
MAAAVTNAGATICDNSRDPCVPNPGSPFPVQETNAVKKPAIKKVHAKPSAPKSAELEKAPPDLPRAPLVVVKRAQSWMPIEIPSQKIQAESETPSTNGASVRVVSANEVNEIDLAASPQLEATPIKVVPIRVALNPSSGVPEEAASRQPAPADTTLLERVFLTFGGAFGAASAFRVFFG